MKRIISGIMVVLILLLSACSAEPASNTQPLYTGEPIPAYLEKSAAFDSLEEYLAFFGMGEAAAEYAPVDMEIYWERVRDYVTDVADGEKHLLIPYFDDEPILLREKAGYSAVTLFGNDVYGWMWTWFHIKSEVTHFTIRIADTPEEYTQLAQTASAAEFIAEVYPTAPNLHNYKENDNYVSAYEKEIFVNGTTVRALFLEGTDGRMYIAFLASGTLIKVVAPVGVITEQWLARLSFRCLDS